MVPMLPIPSKKTSLGLEVGLRFIPTEQELVGHYLQMRIAMGDEFQSNFVSECPEFFGEKEPWVIWQIYGGGDSKNDEETLYFFTNRRRFSPTAKRFIRKVGSGTWSGQHPKKVVDDDGLVIGEKREFRYENGCDSRQNDRWLMQEFQGVDDSCDLVLCTLRKSPRKAPPAVKRNLTEKAKDDNKRKRGLVVDQPKGKRNKKDDQPIMEQQTSCVVDQPIMEQQTSCVVDLPNMDHQLGQDHLLQKGVQFHDDLGYFPDLNSDMFGDDTTDFSNINFDPELSVDSMIDFYCIDEFLGQTPTCYDSNLVASLATDDQVVQFEEEYGVCEELLVSTLFLSQVCINNFSISLTFVFGNPLGSVVILAQMDLTSSFRVLYNLFH
ncbi:NAC transcription factor 29-like [Argentina anserina]|uniref:NAC transcription factor 29-like n=1 Tax=Argentina anserina TaxID=57926 RepID=UPI0021766640|nr:NAC transcription factor 29-like [Potentilla anserina]